MTDPPRAQQMSQAHSDLAVTDREFHSTDLISDPVNTTDCPPETENLISSGLNQDGMFLVCFRPMPSLFGVPLALEQENILISRFGEFIASNFNT